MKYPLLSTALILTQASASYAFTIAPPTSVKATSNSSIRRSPSPLQSLSSSLPSKESITSFAIFAESSSSKSSNEQPKQDGNKPVIEPLQPFVPAMDPNYKNIGPVGESDFFISRTGSPTKEELSNENLYKILMIQCTDLEVNTLVWKCLGYRFNEESKEWTADECFPKWKEKYPTPPDLIGMQRIYSKEVDQPSLKANQSLVRSVPVDNKQSLKTHLRPLGFTGYKYAELTPNKTRRAQCANWLLYYREELFGFTVEELRERRQKKHEAEEQEKLRLEQETGEKAEKEWKPPVKEVF